MKQGDKSKLRLLEAGVKLWPHVTASKVARAAGFKAHRIVSYHFPEGIKDAVAKYAVETGHAPVIVQLISTGHPAVKDMSERSKRKYIKSIL